MESNQGGVEDDVADMDNETVRLEARVQLVEDRVEALSLRLFPSSGDIPTQSYVKAQCGVLTMSACYPGAVMKGIRLCADHSKLKRPVASMWNIQWPLRTTTLENIWTYQRGDFLFIMKNISMSKSVRMVCLLEEGVR